MFLSDAIEGERSLLLEGTRNYKFVAIADLTFFKIDTRNKEDGDVIGMPEL
jgi:hypothetical protein